MPRQFHLQAENRSNPGLSAGSLRRFCVPGAGRLQTLRSLVRGLGLPSSRYVLYIAVFVLPAILLFSSVRTFREIDTQREVYLRQQAAAIAGRLETVDIANQSLESAVLSVADEYPHLRDLKVLSKPDDSDPVLGPLWAGRELFRTGFVNSGPNRVYRAYVPFHSAGVMNLAQIDLDPAAADFITVHARHNIYFSLAGGIALILVSLYSLWATRRAAALQLKQVELEHLARLGTMSAVLAHEIRNPLGTIKGFAQLALEQAGAKEQSLLAPILDQTRRLENLVNDLLVYGRPPSPSVRTVHWPTLAAAIESHARRLAAERPLTISVASSDIDVETDPDLLEQIIVNLVRNAIDAVEDDGEVAVTARRTGRAFEIAVRDNGAGIAETDLLRIREPFYTTKSFGTGLGIPISMRLAKALGGTLDIHNAEPRGVVASVRLPEKA
jgi:two-component system sensor histidine kinase HydH